MNVQMNNIRKDFPLLSSRDTIYLDSAATAQRPKCVIEAENEFYKKHNANPLRGFYPLSLEATNCYEQARKTVQELDPRPVSGRDYLHQKHYGRHQPDSLQLRPYLFKAGG